MSSSINVFFVIGGEVSFFHFDLLDTLILLYLVRNFSVGCCAQEDIY